MFLFGLACCDPVQWVVAFLFWSTIHQHHMGYRRHPSALHTYSFQGLQPNHFTCGPSPVLGGCSSRCPQSKLQLPIFPPQGSFTGRSLGDCLAVFLLWHPLIITSHGGSLAWVWAGTPVPHMMAAHTQGNANLWHNKKKLVLVEDLWLSMLDCHFIGGYISCNMLYHLPSLFFPPILDLPLSLPGICLH